MDERHRSLIQVIQFNRFTLRGYFGESFADKWGFFVDRNMSTEIHSYLDWVEYPMGDHVLEGHKDQVRCAVTSRDGCFLFTGSKGGEIIKWDLRTNEVINRFGTHSTVVFSLAHTPGKLISAGIDTKIKVWNDGDCSLIRTMEGHMKEILSLSLNKRGTILVSGSADQTCLIWSIESGGCLSVMKGHSLLVSCVLFADDVIVSGSYDHSIRFWNPDSGKELRKIADGIGDFVYDLSLNSDSSMLLCCHSYGFTLFKYPSMEVIKTMDTKSYRSCFHPIKPTILAMTDDITYLIKVFGSNFETVRLLEGHNDLFDSIQFTPDGTRLISVSLDNTVRVWDVSDLF